MRGEKPSPRSCCLGVYVPQPKEHFMSRTTPLKSELIAELATLRAQFDAANQAAHEAHQLLEETERKHVELLKELCAQREYIAELTQMLRDAEVKPAPKPTGELSPFRLACMRAREQAMRSGKSVRIGG
jgi:hypothetical protein